MQSIAQNKRRFQTYSVGKSVDGVLTKIPVDDLTHDQLLDTYRLYFGDGAQHILTDEYMRELIKDYIDACDDRLKAAI